MAYVSQFTIIDENISNDSNSIARAVESEARNSQKEYFIYNSLNL